MQERYTENIDKLDSFYHENLREASVEPPAAMWDKIHASYSEQKTPKSFSAKKRILLLLLLLLLISAAGALFYLKNTSAVDKRTGTENREQENKGTGTVSREQVNKETGTENREQVIRETGKSDRKKSEATIDSVHVAAPSIVETAKPLVEETKPKQDTVSAVKEIPKKKMSFREKHTQNIKADSLRPLFVPVK